VIRGRIVVKPDKCPERYENGILATKKLCRNYSSRVGDEDPNYPTLCEKCAPVLKQIADKSGAAS
jgi:hypothetical protein